MTAQESADSLPHLADTTADLPIPEAPSFASPADERRYRKQRLAAALRLFGKYGFGEGISGLISVRDPERPDHFWVNPFGISFNRVRVADLIRADATGTVVEGHHRLNTSAFLIHMAIHDLRPEVAAVAHAHTVHSRALGSLGRLLAPLDQESTAFYQRQALCFDGTEAQGPDIARELGGHRAILLKHHGLITVGESLEEALHWFFTYEACAQIQLLAAAAGTPQPLTHDQAVAAGEEFGDPQLARFSFQPLWDDITHDEPGLLDE